MIYYEKQLKKDLIETLGTDGLLRINNCSAPGKTLMKAHLLAQTIPGYEGLFVEGK